MINRRQFALASTAGLASATAHLDCCAVAEVPCIFNRRLIQLGISALARAPQRSYFADGHRGASMISAHSMCVDNELRDETTNRIIESFDLNWASVSLCAAYPEADPVDDAAKRVGEALSKSGTVPREVGHDAIFAMHAIKAFRLMPELATEERVQGVCDLVGKFKPWRGVDPAEEVNPPSFADSAAASKFILQEASDSIDRFRGFGQGFAGHMLTFGRSLVQLAAMGDVEWAASCRIAFRKYVTVTRGGPSPGDRKIKDQAESKLRPEDKQYWQKRGDKTLGLGRVFKYPYAYHDLLSRANDPKLEKELDDKAWHLLRRSPRSKTLADQSPPAQSISVRSRVDVCRH